MKDEDGVEYYEFKVQKSLFWCIVLVIILLIM
jgi:hypothetical protein